MTGDALFAIVPLSLVYLAGMGFVIGVNVEDWNYQDRDTRARSARWALASPLWPVLLPIMVSVLAYRVISRAWVVARVGIHLDEEDEQR